MNDAGYLQAQFSNSLLLFTERGGFVIPQAPTGVGLAKSLQDGGPLVTSINVNITQNKISTTVKMDLYTSSFGKLQKQKEGNIAQMTREKQKLTDQRNSAIRRGMGKTLSNKNFYESVLKGGGAELIKMAKESSQHFSDFEKGKTEDNNMMIAAQNSWSNGKPQDFNGLVSDTVGDLVKRGQSYIQTNTEKYNQMQAMAQDTVDQLTDASEVVTGFIGDFVNLLSDNIGDKTRPQVPQKPTKRVEDRRGPDANQE